MEDKFKEFNEILQQKDMTMEKVREQGNLHAENLRKILKQEEQAALEAQGNIKRECLAAVEVPGQRRALWADEQGGALDHARHLPRDRVHQQPRHGPRWPPVLLQIKPAASRSPSTK